MPDEQPIIWQLLLQLVLILINAIFACAEIAIISMNDAKLQKLAISGDKRAIRLSKLTNQPARFLATIQVGITLAGFLASAFAADNFSDKLVKLFLHLGVNISETTLDTISVLLITIILSYFTLILGELVPKRIAMRKSEELALAMSGLIYIVSKAFAPIVWFLSVSTNGILKLFGIDPHANDDKVTEEEIRMLVDAGSAEGAIDPAEKEFIQNVFEFDNTSAGEIMTHRTDVILLWADETVDQWDETIVESRHSIYPICSENADDITGILNVKDYFRLKDKTKENILKRAVKSPYFIPETVCADILFRNMKQSKNHFAIVLDEYGGMSGVITMNDLLEQLVGNLDDNDSVSEPPQIEQIDQSTWKVLGSAPLDLVAAKLGVKLPDEDYDTFSGFVFGLLGTVPEDGSKPFLNEFGLTIDVVSIKEHRMEEAVVKLTEN